MVEVHIWFYSRESLIILVYVATSSPDPLGKGDLNRVVAMGLLDPKPALQRTY